MGLTILIETEGLEPEVYEGMLKRFNDWKPIKQRLKLMFELNMRQQFQVDPIGEMKRLGPSILGAKGQFVSVGKKKFTAGTRFYTAPYYNAWRIKRGMPDILEAKDQMFNDLADVIIVWTIDGEGYTKHKIKRRRRGKK
jgi:hypothetical protein